MRDLWLAALLGCTTHLDAALSYALEALRSAVSAASRSPPATASRSLRVAVFSDDLTDLLRRRRSSFCRLRLICDLMLAIGCDPRVHYHAWAARRRLLLAILGMPALVRQPLHREARHARKMG